MARRGRLSSRSRVATESRIVGFAEDLGRLLGAARAKADHYIGERGQLVKTLVGIRDTASSVLADLGHQATQTVRRRRRTTNRRAVAAPVARQRRRRRLSKKARAAMSAAQRARRAREKAASGKK